MAKSSFRLEKEGEVGEVGEVGEMGEVGEVGEIGGLEEVGEVLRLTCREESTLWSLPLWRETWVRAGGGEGEALRREWKKICVVLAIGPAVHVLMPLVLLEPGATVRTTMAR